MSHSLLSLVVKTRFCLAASRASASLAAMLLLISCGGGTGSEVPASKSMVLMIDAGSAIQGVQVDVSRRDSFAFNFNDLKINKNIIGTGIDSQVMTREVSFNSNTKPSYSLVAYSLTGPGSTTLQVFSVSMSIYEKIEVKNIRCAEKAGNPVSCSIRWNNSND
jgi:hypothetical protein